MNRSSTSDDLDERVTAVAPRIIFLRELPVQTPRSIDCMHERVERLADGWERYALVVDLRDARRPDAATRRALKRRIGRIADRVVHTAFVADRNALMAAMAKLVGISFGYRSVSVHPTVDEAVEEARHALER